MLLGFFDHQHFDWFAANHKFEASPMQLINECRSAAWFILVIPVQT